MDSASSNGENQAGEEIADMLKKEGERKASDEEGADMPRICCRTQTGFQFAEPYRSIAARG